MGRAVLITLSNDGAPASKRRGPHGKAFSTALPTAKRSSQAILPMEQDGGHPLGPAVCSDLEPRIRNKKTIIAMIDMVGSDMVAKNPPYWVTFEIADLQAARSLAVQQLPYVVLLPWPRKVIQRCPCLFRPLVAYQVTQPFTPWLFSVEG